MTLASFHSPLGDSSCCPWQHHLLASLFSYAISVLPRCYADIFVSSGSRTAPLNVAPFAISLLCIRPLWGMGRAEAVLGRSTFRWGDWWSKAPDYQDWTRCLQWGVLLLTIAIAPYSRVCSTESVCLSWGHFWLFWSDAPTLHLHDLTGVRSSQSHMAFVT